MKVINKEDYKVPVFSWCENIEESAMSQIDNLAKHPLVVDHVSLMPDCHMGYGACIGSVIATQGGIIVSAIGVDIGCGMRAMKTNLPKEELSSDNLKKIMGEIRKRVPLGMTHNKEPCVLEAMPEIGDSEGYYEIVSEQFDKARYQLGTLGGGNHFIEIQYDESDMIWVMVHSGSRNLGYKVANHYNKVAEDLNKMWKHDELVKQELAFIPCGHDAYNNYSAEMKYCMDFAEANRRYMMIEIREAIEEVIPGIGYTFMCDIHHNYAQLEHHDGSNVLIHRKGATSARKDEWGIIPGSQGSSSYIVKGLGNEKSFNSCSHGAGRCLSRKKARETLDFAEEKTKLDDQGIVHSIRSKADLDEASGAYKDIETVMDEQKDLVNIMHILKPMAVIKG